MVKASGSWDGEVMGLSVEWKALTVGVSLARFHCVITQRLMALTVLCTTAIFHDFLLGVLDF